MLRIAIGRTQLAIALLVALIFVALPAALHAQATTPVTTVVTVLGPKYTAPPPITKDDLIVSSGKKRLPVTSFVPAQAGRAPLQLALLIDDANNSTLSLQFNDMKNFITSQSKNTAVGLFYAQYGTVEPVAQFSTDHAAVAAKLRLPLGRLFGGSPSIYLSASDLIKRWPNTGARREVLLVASGVDFLQPGIVDSYLDQAIEDAQRAGVVFHSIFTGPTRLGRSFHGEIAQRNLSRITSETGGEAFFEGLTTPVSFAPFLNQLDMILQNQYWLTVNVERSKKKKGEMQDFSVKTEQRQVTILSPKQIFVPGP
jgi:hypothetical protein